MFNKKAGKKMCALVLAMTCLMVTAGIPSAMAEEAEEPETVMEFGEPAEWDPPEGATIYTLDTVYRETGVYNPVTGERTITAQTRAQTSMLTGCSVSFYIAPNGYQFVCKTQTGSLEGKARDKIGLMTLKCQIYENGIWRDKMVSNELYNTNASSHSLTRMITLTKGYNYRLYAEHYAQDDLIFGWYNYDKQVQYSATQFIPNN